MARKCTRRTSDRPFACVVHLTPVVTRHYEVISHIVEFLHAIDIVAL